MEAGAAVPSIVSMKFCFESYMKTYPTVDEKSGLTLAFEIENIYVNISNIARTLSNVDGVASVRVRRPFSKWEEIHIWFKYLNHDCVVLEPFGDNSRYWIGSMNPKEATLDMGKVENVFKQYRPPFIRELIGDILSLRIFSRLFRKA
jgi:hypothetical protein